MKARWRWVMAAGLGLGVMAGVVWLSVPEVRVVVMRKVRGRVSVEARVAQYGPAARARMTTGFERAGVTYPPRRVVLAAFKREKRLEVYAGGAEGPVKLVGSYPILAASGGPGPKLREGDRQVPEGLYRVESLNPNSLYHLALRLDYPIAEDRAQGARDGRTTLGGDIMIHGSNASIGCLAMGDEVAEELFVLAAEAGVGNVQVVMAPADLRVVDVEAAGWVRERYAMIAKALGALTK